MSSRQEKSQCENPIIASAATIMFLRRASQKPVKNFDGARCGIYFVTSLGEQRTSEVAVRRRSNTPGNRARLVLCRCRGDYGCVWTTQVRRTDAPGVPLGSTRITQDEVAARNRRARFPAAHCSGVLRIASAADPARPLPCRRVRRSPR
jgi:hypothetical protein